MKIHEHLLHIILAFTTILLVIIDILQLTTGIVILAVVKGRSMLPLLIDGDIVIVIPTNDVSLGDVVVYLGSYGQYVVHRVVAIIYCTDGQKIIVTKGDNNPYLDTEVYSIAGRVSIICKPRLVEIDPNIDERTKMYIKELAEHGMLRGIPLTRVVGKVFNVLGAVIKISSIGLLSPRR